MKSLNLERRRTDHNLHGMKERFNRALQQFVNENHNDWDDHLPHLILAYRVAADQYLQCHQ